MKHKLFSRFISVLLAVVMLASLMSMPSLATDDVQEPDPAVTSGEQMTDSTESDVADPTDDPAAQSDEITDEGNEDTSSGENTDEPVVSGEENDETVVSGEENSEEAVSGEEEATVPSEEETVSNDEAASSEKEDASSQEETAPAAVQLNAEAKDENDNVVANVTAEADEGVIPEGATLVADLLTGNDAETAAAELDEAGVEYDGYMALDIHLEDADGNEVEPNGEVRVVMVAPAALPEDADPTTVAVQHHEEQDNGEVKVEEVASAADTAALAATPATLSLTENSAEETPAPTVTTDNSDVTAAFTVDSFSKFTITWTDSNGGQQKATMYYVEESGSQILVENLDPQTATGEIDFDNYRDKVNWNEYTYLEARLNYGPAESKPENYVDVTAVSVRYTDEYGWQYKKQVNSREWTSWNLPDGVTDHRIFLVYRDTTNENDKTDPGQKVETVNTDGKIAINLFNYNNSGYDNINSGHYLYFSGATNSSDNRKGGEDGRYVTYTHPNFWTTTKREIQDGVLQGIVQNKLDKDGNPVLSPNSNWNWDVHGQWWGGNDKDNAEWPSNDSEAESLSYLFDSTVTNPGQGGVTREVEGANYLFQQDADGYYYFDSATNRAVLNNAGDFDVYSNPSNYFSPFSDKNSNSLDDFFGMTIETTFVMPEDGLVNGQPMTFEFSGDDDVWVFIDGVLVLDMGGNHGKATGSINFSTGAVSIDYVNHGTVGDVTSVTDSITEHFNAAGESWNNAAYETHTLKFFYLERGSNQSNCKIRFNLPIVPDGSLSIAKELEKTGSKELQQYLMDTVNYKFRVLKAETTGTSQDDLFIKQLDGEGQQVKYEIWKDGVFTGDYGNVAADGTITLKAGQMAVFPGVITSSCDNFYVQELIPENANGQYGNVSYNVSNNGGNSNEVNSDNVVIEDTSFEGYNSNIIDPPDGDAYKNESYTVNFTNTVNTDNLALLKITKDVPGGAVNDTDTFKVQVTVNDQLLPVGTTYTVEGINDPQTVDEVGIITLKAGQTASILMLAGEDTDYKVVEQPTYDQKVYQFGSYTGTSEYTDSENNKHNDTLSPTDSKRETGITNTVTYAGQVDSITVTNNTTKGYLTIEKKLAEGSKLMGEGKDVFAFKIQKCDESGNPTGTVWYMYANGAQQATLNGTDNALELESGTYQITELSNINYTCINIEATDGKIEGDKPTSGSYTIKVSVGGNATTNVIYTNERSDKGFTDGSGVINKFSDTNGKITFDRIPIAGDPEEKNNWEQQEPTDEQQN